MSARRASLTATLIALVTLMVGVQQASATFHLVSVREVFPGTAAQPGAEYVELQMWASNQHLVAGHLVRTYDSAGKLTGTDAFPADVARSANQSTLVLATTEAEAAFGFVADGAMAPAVTPTGRLDPSGGAVCWEEIDCVAWGAFSGALPSPVGAPAAAIPDGQALRRTIAPGCPTLLESSDDRDNSALDFAPVFPAPRPNSVVPSEIACPRSGSGAEGGGGAAGGDAGAHAHEDAPQTILRGKPPKRSRDRTPTFRFGADEARARFECKIDRKAFRGCRSPFTTKSLAPGPHVFKVRARSDAGADPTPASYAFTILAKP
ncbi:MAG TPA: hypothetical protein VFI03_01630 [Solirubrobacterales bacterium]|nr:hypothetical protein [Solirubrobacterales bacterium]